MILHQAKIFQIIPSAIVAGTHYLHLPPLITPLRRLTYPTHMALNHETGLELDTINHCQIYHQNLSKTSTLDVKIWPLLQTIQVLASIMVIIVNLRFPLNKMVNITVFKLNKKKFGKKIIKTKTKWAFKYSNLTSFPWHQLLSYIFFLYKMHFPLFLIFLDGFLLCFFNQSKKN